MPSATLDAAPPLPDAVKSAMGPPTGGFEQIGKMMSKGGAPAGPEGASAQGNLKVQIDTIKKVLDSIIGSAGPGKTFFSRAAQMLDQGLAAESSKGPGTSATKGPDQAGDTGGGGMASPPSFPG
jgi:hypothetical protein